MKLKTWLPAILAVLLGGAAAFLVRNSMLKTKPTQTVMVLPKVVPAVMATTDLMAGQEITAENLSVTQVPSSNPPQDVVGNPVELVGRVLSTPVTKGQPIHQSNLAPKGVAANLPSLIPSGMRAITINVDEGNSLAGMLMPGCHVDVIATIAAGKESITRTLVSNVLVQAVGQRLTSAKPEDGKEPPPFHTVTLIVAPRDGQMLDLAAVSARLRLLLRPLTHGPADEVETEKVTMAELIGGDESRSTAAILPTTMPSSDGNKVALVTQPKRDVVLILGNAVTHVKLEMPEIQPVQADTSTQLQPVIEGREPNQE